MGVSGRLILVAGLMAALAWPYTFLSEPRANAAGAPAGSAVMEVDDSGPLPAWWAQTVYGEPRGQAAPSGMARGSAGSAVMEADDSGPLPAWWAQSVYGEPGAQAGPAGIAEGPAQTVTEGATAREPLHFIGEATAGH